MKIAYCRVRELFDYHEGGYLIWKIANGPRCVIGAIAGTSDPQTGYFQVQIDGVIHRVHRIIFLWHNGYLPELVDHEDQDKENNRILNLRDISRQCNNRNCKLRKDNTSGVKGISWHKTQWRWASRITINKKLIHLGMFDDFDDAVIARYKAEVDSKWKGCDSNSSSFLYLKEKNILPVQRIKKSKV